MEEVLKYFESLPEPQRSSLTQLRTDLLALIPGATEGFSYGMPAVILNGKAVAGYFAFKNHLGFFHTHRLSPLSSLMNLGATRFPRAASSFPLTTSSEWSLWRGWWLLGWLF